MENITVAIRNAINECATVDNALYWIEQTDKFVFALESIECTDAMRNVEPEKFNMIDCPARCENAVDRLENRLEKLAFVAIASHVNKVQANRMLRNNAMDAKELREFIAQYRNNLTPEFVERIARNVEFETGIKCELGGAI